MKWLKVFTQSQSEQSNGFSPDLDLGVETGIARLGTMTPAGSALTPINQPQTVTQNTLGTENPKLIESRLLWRLNVTAMWTAMRMAMWMATPFEMIQL